MIDRELKNSRYYYSKKLIILRTLYIKISKDYTPKDSREKNHLLPAKKRNLLSCLSREERKQKSHLVIKPSTGFALFAEMRWPAPREPLFSFSKRASAKKWRFGESLVAINGQAKRGLGHERRFDPE